MTNRDRYILKRNECDVLCDIQLAMLHGFGMCIIDCLTHKTHPCPKRSKEDKFIDCCHCIEKWLNNEEAK